MNVSTFYFISLALHSLTTVCKPQLHSSISHSMVKPGEEELNTYREKEREREKCRICFAIIDLNPISNPSNGRLLQVLWQTFGQKLTFTKHRLSHTYARVTKWIFPMNSNEWIEHISLIMMKVERIFFFHPNHFPVFVLFFSLFLSCNFWPVFVCASFNMSTMAYAIFNYKLSVIATHSHTE